MYNIEDDLNEMIYIAIEVSEKPLRASELAQIKKEILAGSNKGEINGIEWRVK